MFYPEEIIEEVRSKNDIVDVISQYVKLKKQGSNYKGLCPFHSEKTPSFSVGRDRQMYYCFGCGAGGNVITFLMEYENCTFQEAVKLLADRAGVSLPETDSGESRERESRRSRLLALHREAAKYYVSLLRTETGKTALAYLHKRELTDETIKHFGLGYASKYGDDLYQYLKTKGYQPEEMISGGLAVHDEKNGIHDRFWNRVMFPILDSNSRVIAFGGRVMGDGKPKYLNSPEMMIFDKSQNLYGLHMAKRARTGYLLLCEGYMDVIALHQAGFTSAVASLGTSLTEGHALLLRRYVEEVYLTYDSDEAGKKAALRALPILEKAGLRGKVLSMAPYKDPDEFLKNLGADAFRERIGQARNGFLFQIAMLQQEYDMGSPEGKTAFYRNVAKKLGEFEDELEQTTYIEAVARELRISKESLQKLVVKTAVAAGLARPVVRPPSPNRAKQKKTAEISPKRTMLSLFVQKEQLIDALQEYVSPEDFGQGLYRQVAELLYEQHRQGGLEIARLLDAFSEEEVHREVTALFHESLEKPGQGWTSRDWETAVRETVIRLKKESLKQEGELQKELAPDAYVAWLIKERKLLEALKNLHISID